MADEIEIGDQGGWRSGIQHQLQARRFQQTASVRRYGNHMGAGWQIKRHQTAGPELAGEFAIDKRAHKGFTADVVGGASD